MKLYQLDGMTPVLARDFERWALWMQDEYPKVRLRSPALCSPPGFCVHNDFKPVDMNEDGKVFETRLAVSEDHPRRDCNGETYRFATWAEAEAMTEQLWQRMFASR